MVIEIQVCEPCLNNHIERTQPVDVKTRLCKYFESCQIEIHNSIETTKFLVKYYFF